MKVKLLKKIRKKFDYWILKDGNAILFNKVDKTFLNIDEDYLNKRLSTITLEEYLKKWNMSKDQVVINTIKTLMFEEFGFNRLEYLYNFKYRKFKRSKK